MTKPAPQAQHDGQIAQVLIKLGELSTQMAVLQTKMDSLPVSDHEMRLRSLERFKWALAGAVALGGAAAGWVASLLFQGLHG